MTRRDARGFTLLEMAISAALVVLLVALATPMVLTALKREKEQELRTALRQIRQALDDYKQAGDDGRIARRPGDTGWPASLGVLVTGVPDTLDPKRRIYFLRRIPRDPFAADGADADATWGKRSSDSPPDAPAPGADVYDVHSLSQAVGLNGVPYRDW
ncbi:MAG: type II secretion system GspH family protein [Burkholderiales bacterium]|jgi:general secretion pathway protein G|nr:type II secretion system GspH family protein [Burkholderiales bacterium]